MQIQVNTDNHIRGSAELTEQVQATVEKALDRFSARISRVVVHISDENSKSKTHEDDKRCLMEARIKGMQPVSVSHQESSVRMAIDGAASKLEKSLKRTFDRLDDPRAGPAANIQQRDSEEDEASR